MIENVVALREAWRTTLAGIGVGQDVAVVVGGPPAEAIAEAVPMAVADEVAGLAILGSGPSLAADATPSSTGLPTDTADAVMMLAAWRSPEELRSVVAEARRVLAPGGRLILGEVDVDALLTATVATRRSSLLYRRYRSPILASLPGDRPVAAPAFALLRGGFGSIESATVDLPVGVFSTPGAYVEAVLAGVWPGIGIVPPHERTALEGEILESLRGTAFPLTEYQPWSLAYGIAP